VERCADILESMTGTRPSDGWVHALLGRAARAVAAANKTIRALIILARVVCGDETPIRSGPGPRAKKKYLHVACTSLLTYYFLGDRGLPSFNAFVYSDLHGTVVVHDRYQNYDKFDGVAHQLCTAHLLRDLEDAAQAYPDAIWPGQAADALRALIHQANLARGRGLDAVPADRAAKDLGLFRNAVLAGLSDIGEGGAQLMITATPPAPSFRSGVDIVTVAELMGHSSLETTRLYTSREAGGNRRTQSLGTRPRRPAQWKSYGRSASAETRTPPCWPRRQAS
jgi:hypothetical protein